MTSPLQLEHYFFERVHCVVNPEVDIEQAQHWLQESHERFSIRADLAQNTDKEREYQVRVEVKSNVEDSESAPYQIHFSVVGFFTLSEEFEHENIERLVQVNGASVLYSAMREFVLTVTSRCAWGNLMLPTVNFRLLAPPDDQD